MKFSSELEEFVPSTAPLTGPFSEKFEEKIQPSWRIESRKRYQCTTRLQISLDYHLELLVLNPVLLCPEPVD